MTQQQAPVTGAVIGTLAPGSLSPLMYLNRRCGRRGEQGEHERVEGARLQSRELFMHAETDSEPAGRQAGKGRGPCHPLTQKPVATALSYLTPDTTVVAHFPGSYCVEGCSTSVRGGGAFRPWALCASSGC